MYISFCLVNPDIIYLREQLANDMALAELVGFRQTEFNVFDSAKRKSFQIYSKNLQPFIDLGWLNIYQVRGMPKYTSELDVYTMKNIASNLARWPKIVMSEKRFEFTQDDLIELKKMCQSRNNFTGCIRTQNSMSVFYDIDSYYMLTGFSESEDQNFNNDIDFLERAANAIGQPKIINNTLRDFNIGISHERTMANTKSKFGVGECIRNFSKPVESAADMHTFEKFKKKKNKSLYNS